MSRRRGEFEHRTSIFEGAFRAWSHIGGLEPEDLESKPVADLDPLTNPIENDIRLKGKEGKADMNPNGTKRRQYPYEPLPRSGLAHPYVQAILSPWLGPDADNDAIQLGLTTLRTWWQHRRKGESGSAIAALGTEKMKGVVEGYTRHFFTLAHCLIMNDKEQPPRSLHAKMKEVEKSRSKKNKKRSRDNDGGGSGAVGGGGGVAVGGGGNMMSTMASSMGGVGPNGMTGTAVAAGIAADLTNNDLSPLERLHVAQQRQLAVDGGFCGIGGGFGGNDPMAGMVDPSLTGGQAVPIMNIKNKCVPGKPDLPGIVDQVTSRANQLAHSGTSTRPGAIPSSVTSGSGGGGGPAVNYGDPDSVPIVFVTETGDSLIAMSVDGITCAHCVKIVETVLRGCNGNKSPIDGLVDAAADRDLCAVLIRCDRTSSSKRIAFEAARNLAMVGYTAKAKSMSPSVEKNGEQTKVALDEMYKAFDAVARSDIKDLFDWSSPCSCPDNGVARADCPRHSQMSNAIFDAFDVRGMLVHQFLAGDKLDTFASGQPHNQQMMNGQYNHPGDMMMGGNVMQPLNDSAGMAPIDMFGHGGGNDLESAAIAAAANLAGNNNGQMAMRGHRMSQRAGRNSSVISFGNHRMSLTGRMSEVSYGRAMSGLSALSIDWENMDDFDINVDHSAHINNNNSGQNNLAGAAAMMGGGPMMAGGIDLDPKPIGPGGPRRSSLRTHLMSSATGGYGGGDSHVTFDL
mmetsp:Transcript_48990/g.118656  ORF Transcript_48990/g.118656 Transcript_48990/m.118656 type:complete len:737 (+) Transcript_48990:397-2607(+)